MTPLARWNVYLATYRDGRVPAYTTDCEPLALREAAKGNIVRPLFEGEPLGNPDPAPDALRRKAEVA